MQSRAIYAAMVTLALAAAPLARGTAIPVTNAGFEGPAVADFNAGPITGWTIEAGSGAGVWNVEDASFGYWSTGAPEGKQVAYVARDNPPGSSSILQALTDVLLDNSIYTLSGYVGHPAGYGSGTLYTVELLAGTTVLSSISGTGPERAFDAFTLTFNSTGSALVGQPLAIRLAGSQAQTAFDDIGLEVTQAPEPSTALGAVLALLMGGLARRLRR